jgi:glycine dehydrogenase subunit 2
MLAIAREAETDPDLVRTAPHETAVTRLDEVTAARHPDLRWRPAPAQQERGAERAAGASAD